MDAATSEETASTTRSKLAITERLSGGAQAEARRRVSMLAQAVGHAGAIEAWGGPQSMVAAVGSSNDEGQRKGTQRPRQSAA